MSAPTRLAFTLPHSDGRPPNGTAAFQTIGVDREHTGYTNLRFDASGCNGCDIEVLEATTLVSWVSGYRDCERPDDANLLVVTGGSNLKNQAGTRNRLQRVAGSKNCGGVGSCAATMGIFKGGYSMAADR